MKPVLLSESAGLRAPALGTLIAGPDVLPTVDARLGDRDVVTTMSPAAVSSSTVGVALVATGASVAEEEVLASVCSAIDSASEVASGSSSQTESAPNGKASFSTSLPEM